MGIKTSLKETLMSVGPVVIIILLIKVFFVPMPADLTVRFLVGAVLLWLGLAIFNLGVSVGMEPMGDEIGAGMAKSRRFWIIVVTGFIVGFIATLAEPDLKVLSKEVNTAFEGSIPPALLMISIAVGVGIMTVLSLLRILFQWPLRNILWISYAAIFTLAAFVSPDYIPVGFDSGGVTTGPMTVPFILSMGIGVSSIRSDKNAEDDSFGLVGLVSTGPIFAILILGVLAK